MSSLFVKRFPSLSVIAAGGSVFLGQIVFFSFQNFWVFIFLPSGFIAFSSSLTFSYFLSASLAMASITWASLFLLCSSFLPFNLRISSYNFSLSAGFVLLTLTFLKLSFIHPSSFFMNLLARTLIFSLASKTVESMVVLLVNSLNLAWHSEFFRLYTSTFSFTFSWAYMSLNLVTNTLWSLSLTVVPFLDFVIFVSTWFLASSILRLMKLLLISLLNMTMSIQLSSVLFFVTLRLVMVPEHLVVPFATTSACLSIMLASIFPFGEIPCGSLWMYCGPSFALASISIIIDLPANSDFTISASKVTKKGILLSSSQFSWGPHPVIILIFLFLASTSTTSSSNGSLYSSTSFGRRFSSTAHNMPPFFAFRIASNTTKFAGSLTLPLHWLCVSWSVTTLARVDFTSFMRLSAFPVTTPAAFVEKIVILSITLLCTTVGFLVLLCIMYLILLSLSSPSVGATLTIFTNFGCCCLFFWILDFCCT